MPTAQKVKMSKSEPTSAMGAPERPSTKLGVLETLPCKSEDLPEVCTSDDLGPFYGQTHERGYCSNFYEKPFDFPVTVLGIPRLTEEFSESIEFRTSEACFMFLKGATFLDRNPEKNIEIMHQIVDAPKPAQAKGFGRHLDCRPLNKKSRFDNETWVKERCNCMYDAIFYKFTSGNYVMELGELMKEERHLVEATQNDTVWGNGLHMSNEDLYIPSNWNGTNLLGETLMVFREEMKNDF
jgi:ribA/ribD-fused uncharacterized protein